MGAVTLAPEVAGLLGTPWSPSFACWELVRVVQRHFGHDLPLIPGALAENHVALVRMFATSPERSNWTPVSDPRHGDVVLMARNDAGRHREIHAGVYLVLERPGVLHVDKPHGTVLDGLAALRLRGWHTLTFYRHL